MSSKTEGEKAVWWLKKTRLYFNESSHTSSWRATLQIRVFKKRFASGRVRAVNHAARYWNVAETNVYKRWRSEWKHCSFCFISRSQQRGTFQWWSMFPRWVIFFHLCVVFFKSLNDPALTHSSALAILFVPPVKDKKTNKTPTCPHCWIKINFALIPCEAAARPFFFSFSKRGWSYRLMAQQQKQPEC